MCHQLRWPNFSNVPERYEWHSFKYVENICRSFRQQAPEHWIILMNVIMCDSIRCCISCRLPSWRRKWFTGNLLHNVSYSNGYCMDMTLLVSCDPCVSVSAISVVIGLKFTNVTQMFSLMDIALLPKENGQSRGKRVNIALHWHMQLPGNSRL